MNQNSNKIHEVDKYFQGDIFRYFVFLRSYSRWLDSENRRETWEEVVDRYINFMADNLRDKLTTEEYKEVRSAILNMGVMPSMRLMWSAGEPCRKNNISAFNCSYVAIESLKDFADIVVILSNGCGLGFSCEKEAIDKLPIIKEQVKEEDLSNIFIIPDSKEGWANALNNGLEYWFNGKEMYFDYSQIRPAGARLKTFGGRASGPGPLKELLEFTRNVILNAQGRKLTSLEVHDIVCKIGQSIVSGGVRRTALISLSDLEDKEMRSAKTGAFWEKEPQRSLSNNSAIYKKKPSQQEFMEEWLALMKSGTGERGIFNRENFNITSPRRAVSDDLTGLNPCQPYWAPILTPLGIKKFGELRVGDEIWSEKTWTKIVNKISTGIKPVFEYRTNAGVFYGTENHKVLSNGIKIEVKESDSIDICEGIALPPGNLIDSLDPQDIMDGLMIGDGSIHLASAEKVYLDIGYKDGDYFESEVKDLIIGDHAVKYGRAYKVNTTIEIKELPRTFERFVPDRFFYGSPTKVAGFLRGLYSANGSILGNGRITLKTTSKDIVDRIQIMLSSLGIKSYFTTNEPTQIKWNNGEYISKKSYDVNISTDRDIFYRHIGFIQKYKTEKLSKFIDDIKSGNGKTNYDINSVKYLRDEEVFDITVDNESHTYWTGGLNVSNCGEIGLLNKEFCNLTSVVCRANDTLDSLMKKIRVATILGTYQSTLTDFKYISNKWKENCDKERLLGVSLNGQFDCDIIRNPSILSILKSEAIKTNLEYSKRFGINQSVAITAVKPEGTCSQLLNCSSGIHPRYAKYYIRRIRISTTDPLFKLFKDAGMRCSPEVGQSELTANTWVVEFPIKSPDGSITRHDMTAINQLEYWEVVKSYYTEHNPSMTCYVGEDEWLSVAKWVWDMWNIVGGIAFLPKEDSRHVYELAPYEEITENEYANRIRDWPKVDFSLLSKIEQEDNTTGAQELACLAGCDIL